MKSRIEGKKILLFVFICLVLYLVIVQAESHLSKSLSWKKIENTVIVYFSLLNDDFPSAVHVKPDGESGISELGVPRGLMSEKQ